MSPCLSIDSSQLPQGNVCVVLNAWPLPFSVASSNNCNRRQWAEEKLSNPVFVSQHPSEKQSMRLSAAMYHYHGHQK